MGFGSLGISELLVIFVIVLVFFGPKRMPEVARSLGSAMREFRRSLNQIQRELEEADPTRDLRKEARDLKKEANSILSQLPEQVRPSVPGLGTPEQTSEARRQTHDPAPEPDVRSSDDVRRPDPAPSSESEPSDSGSGSG